MDLFLKLCPQDMGWNWYNCDYLLDKGVGFGWLQSLG